MPEQIVGENVVLEELGNKCVEYRILRRRVLNQSLVGLEMNPVFTARVSIGPRLKQ
jgi:hypothetical protein